MQLSFFDVAKPKFGLEDVANYVRKRDAFREHILDGTLRDFINDECKSYHGGFGGGFCYQYSGKGIMFADHVFSEYSPDNDVIVFNKNEFIGFVEDTIEFND